MVQMFKKFTSSSLLCLALVLMQQGCSSKEEAKITEIPTTAGTVKEEPATLLFEQGKRQFSLGTFLVARETFQSLIDSYPLSPYTEFAEIKIADTFFELNDFADAALKYEEVLTKHPGSTAVPYLLLRAGRSHHLSSKGPGRDTTPLRKALEHYDKLLSAYPDSMYADAAGKFKRKVQLSLVKHVELVAAYYKKRNYQAAYEARQDSLKKEWGDLLNTAKSGPASPALLHAKRADDQKAPPSPVLVSGVRETESNELSSSVFKQTVAAEHPPVSIVDGFKTVLQVAEVKCSPEKTPAVVFFFNRGISKAFDKDKTLSSSNGQLNFNLAEPLRTEMVINCFKEQDLTINKEGLVTLMGEHQFKPLTLNHPPRLALFKN
jgi:outer membrane protein assembly factor BamD